MDGSVAAWTEQAGLLIVPPSARPILERRTWSWAPPAAASAATAGADLRLAQEAALALAGALRFGRWRGQRVCSESAPQSRQGRSISRRPSTPRSGGRGSASTPWVATSSAVAGSASTPAWAVVGSGSHAGESASSSEDGARPARCWGSAQQRPISATSALAQGRVRVRTAGSEPAGRSRPPARRKLGPMRGNPPLLMTSA